MAFSLFSFLFFFYTHRHECLPSRGKVERAKNQTRLGILVAIDPASSEQVPFWLELPTQLASKSALQRCQQDRNCIVPRRPRQRLISRVDQLDGSRHERLCVELVKGIGRRLLRSQGAQRQERRGRKELKPAHGYKVPRLGFADGVRGRLQEMMGRRTESLWKVPCASHRIYQRFSRGESVRK